MLRPCSSSRRVKAVCLQAPHKAPEGEATSGDPSGRRAAELPHPSPLLTQEGGGLSPSLILGKGRFLRKLGFSMSVCANAPHRSHPAGTGLQDPISFFFFSTKITREMRNASGHLQPRGSSAKAALGEGSHGLGMSFQQLPRELLLVEMHHQDHSIAAEGWRSGWAVLSGGQGLQEVPGEAQQSPQGPAGCSPCPPHQGQQQPGSRRLKASGLRHHHHPPQNTSRSSLQQ